MKMAAVREGLPPSKTAKRTREHVFQPFDSVRYVFDDNDDATNQLGAGRTSKVRKARDTKTGKAVAVKAFQADVGEAKVSHQTHALAEVSALRALLPHQHIIALHETSVLANGEGNLFMVMELAVWDWRQFIQSRHAHGAPVGQLKGWIHQAAQALRYCHQRHVVHRDVKPENILIDGQNQVKLADFGLASRHMWHYAEHTEVVTTLWQRAPEVLLGWRGYDERIDVWSLAMTCIELLTLEPFIACRDEKHQLSSIYDTCGTPIIHEWPAAIQQKVRKSFAIHKPTQLSNRLIRHSEKRLRFMPPDARSTFEPMLELNPEKRTHMLHVLEAPYFVSKEPLPYPSEKMICYRK